MNIIFLDIDGVIATPRAWAVNSRSDTDPCSFIMDPVSIAAVNKLCYDNNAEIVISSTWQFEQDKDTLIDLLLRQGLDTDKFLFAGEGWRTSKIDLGSKVRNIKQWMSEQGTPINWVVLDDLTLGTGEKEFDKHIVATDAIDGILHKHFLKASRILRGEFSPSSNNVWAPQ